MEIFGDMEKWQIWKSLEIWKIIGHNFILMMIMRGNNWKWHETRKMEFLKVKISSKSSTAGYQWEFQDPEMKLRYCHIKTAKKNIEVGDENLPGLFFGVGAST